MPLNPARWMIRLDDGTADPRTGTLHPFTQVAYDTGKFRVVSPAEIKAYNDEQDRIMKAKLEEGGYVEEALNAAVPTPAVTTEPAIIPPTPPTAPLPGLKTEDEMRSMPKPELAAWAKDAFGLKLDCNNLTKDEMIERITAPVQPTTNV